MRLMRSLLGLGIFIALLDQVSKWIAGGQLNLGDSWVLIPGFFHLTLVHNTGGAFGLFSQKTIFFILLSVLTIVFLLWYFRRVAQKTPWLVWPIGMVLGGAVGNLIDRVRLGYVVDFLDFFVGVWHWPAFNLADSGICVGLAILAWTIGKGE